MTISTSGEKRSSVDVKLARGNTFAWSYKVTTPTEVQFKTKVRLSETQTLALEDRLTVNHVSATEPSVFLVVDRTAYRPTQTLHFAGFLRTVDPRGEFQPLPNREVEVHLVSEKKGTRAFKAKITSDSFAGSPAPTRSPRAMRWTTTC